MATFNTFEIVHPLRLYKEDLLELEQVLKQDMTIKGDSFCTSVTVDDPKVSAKRFHSFADILDHTHVKQARALTVDAREPDDTHQIDKHVQFMLNETLVDYRIHCHDEQWFNAKAEQLNEFFKTRKPWYGLFSKIFPVIANVMIIISLLLLVPVLRTGDHLPLIFPGLLFAYALVLMVLGFNRIVFPYARVYLISREQAAAEREYEKPMLWAGALVLAISVGGALTLG